MRLFSSGYFYIFAADQCPKLFQKSGIRIDIEFGRKLFHLLGIPDKNTNGIMAFVSGDGRE